MAKRKRNIQILFCVSPEEKKLIRRKMIESKTKNMGAYLRKMAIDGYIVNADTNLGVALCFRYLLNSVGQSQSLLPLAHELIFAFYELL